MHRVANLFHPCFAILAVILLSLTSFAQQQVPSTAPVEIVPTVTPMVGPLFLEDGEFSSALTIVNNLMAPHPVTVVLTDPSGAEVGRKELLVQGHANEVLQIRELLSTSGASATFGSVLITTPDADSIPIAAQLSVTWAATGRAFFEQELLMPSAGLQTFRATAVDVRDSPLVAIKSLSSNAQSVTIACLPEKGPATSGKIQLAAGELRVVPACSPDMDGQTYLSAEVRKDADDEDSNSNGRLGSVGVAVATDGQSQDLAVSGFSVYRDERGPYFSSLSFMNASGQSPSRIILTGVPAGTIKRLSNTKFRPVLGVTDFSENPALVKITLAPTTAGKPSPNITSVTVSPKSTATVHLSPIDGDEITTSIVLESDHPAGDITSSFIAKGNPIIPLVELQPKDANRDRSSGGYPWSIENGRSSTLLLFNHSSQAEQFEVGIGSGASTWQQTYQLASMETRAISINDIIASQQADQRGHKLPIDVLSGQVMWKVKNSGSGTGRLLESDPNVGLARSFSSLYACTRLCPTGILSPDASSLINVGDNGDLGGIVVHDCGYPCYPEYGCGLQSQDTGYQDFPDVFSWVLPSIVSLQSVDPGNGTARFVGVSPGSGTSSWHAKISDDPYLCTVAGNAPHTVMPAITAISPARGLVGIAINPVTITGRGFAQGATVSAGTNITVSDVMVKSSTQITATFTSINSSSAGGNQAVSVKVGTQPSDPKNPKYFYVQIPTSVSFDNYEDLVLITDGTVVDYWGTPQALHKCGGYRNVSEDLWDKDEQLIVGGPFTWTESFSNHSTTANDPTPGTKSTGQNTANAPLTDLQLYSRSAPICPGPDDHESFDQSFKVTIGGKDYPLTTVFHWERGNYSGVFHIDGTVKVP